MWGSAWLLLADGGPGGCRRGSLWESLHGNGVGLQGPGVCRGGSPSAQLAACATKLAVKINRPSVR